MLARAAMGRSGRGKCAHEQGSHGLISVDVVLDCVVLACAGSGLPVNAECRQRAGLVVDTGVGGLGAV